MKETLYIKFGLDSDYFEVELEDIEPFVDEEIEQGKKIQRRKWGRVLIKNYPYKYSTNPTSKNKLYNEILSLDPTTEIYIKHLAENGDETEGYFGVIDCEIEDTKAKKYLEVTPTIFDEYTYFLENWQTKINVFGEENLIYNPDFSIVSTGTIPDGWDYLTGQVNPPSQYVYDVPRVDTIFNTKAVALRARDYVGPFSNAVETVIYQSGININANTNVEISFYYALIKYWNPDNNNVDLRINIKLESDTETYYAATDGNWYTEERYIVYETNKIPIPLNDTQSLTYYTKILQPAPVSGSATITIYSERPVGNFSIDIDNDLTDEDVYYEADLYITGVSVTSSRLKYRTVNVEFKNDDLVIKKQSEIRREDGSYYEKLFLCSPLKKDVEDYEEDTNKNWLERYFDFDGSPDYGLLGDEGYGPHDSRDIRYDNIKEIIETEEDHMFYKAQMYELTIYRGFFNRDNFISRLRLQIRGTAKYAREEVYSLDTYTEEDFLNGRCDEDQVWDGTSPRVFKNYRPPEYDVGWTQSTIDPKNGMLWIRTPYNGTQTEWDLGDIDSVAGKENGFTYTAKLTSRRIYPTEGNSLIFEGAVEAKGVIERMFRGTHPKLKNKNVYSTFLWNDYPNTDKTNALLNEIPALNSGDNINYYTLENNFLNNLVFIHTYDLEPEKTTKDDDSVLELSMEEMLTDLMIKIPYLYFYMDSESNLHIEHLIFEDKVNNFIDIGEEARKYNTWKYNKKEMYAVIDFESVNSGYRDHSYSQLRFDKIVSSRRAVDIRSTKATKYITTDIQYCVEDIEDVTNGLILLEYNPSDNKVVYGTGRRSGDDVINGNLSIASMLATFGTYEGVWEIGYINDVKRAFYNTMYTKEGIEDIELSGIKKENYFLTDLGIGYARSKIMNYTDSVTTITPVYRYNEWYIIVEQDNILEL